MLTNDGGAGFAPAATAIAVVVAITGSLWWNSREEPRALPVPVAAPEVQVKVAPAPPPPARAVVAFVGFADAQAPSALPMEQAAEGLQQLAAALAARGGNYLWRDRALRLEEAAARLEGEADPLQQADITREAFVQAAEWIAQLEGGADSVLEVARDIDGDLPLADQGDVVTRFFRSAAESLRSRRAPRVGENRA